MTTWEIKQEPKNERGGRASFLPHPSPLFYLRHFSCSLWLFDSCSSFSLLLNCTETLATQAISVTISVCEKKQFSLHFFFSILQDNIVYRVSFIFHLNAFLVSVCTKGSAYLLCWPRGRGIGLLVCTRRLSFHEFYDFLLFNFLILIFFSHDFYPHPRPTTSIHYPRPTTFSYTHQMIGFCVLGILKLLTQRQDSQVAGAQQQLVSCRKIWVAWLLQVHQDCFWRIWPTL